MRAPRPLIPHPLLLVVEGVVLIAGHVVFFNRLWHAGVSLAVVSGLVLLIPVKHLGVFGSLYGLFRRRSQRWKDDGSARPAGKLKES
jgi:uncharacterized membrane protein HdeD (DUF308 family)